MGFIPALLTGLSGIAGGLLNKPQQQKSTSQTTSDSTQNTAATGSQLPVYDPYQLQMRNYLISQFYNRSNPAYINNLVNTSVNQGVNAINDAANPQQQALQAALASRGLSYSGTAGTALANQQQGRIGQITALQAQKPLLADSLQNTNLTSFSDYLSKLPVGSSTSATGYANTQGTSNTNTTGTTTGNPVGGAVAGAGGALGLLYGLGAFKNNNYTPGNQNTSGGGGTIN